VTPRLMVALVLAAGLAGCYREKREFQSPPQASPADPVKASELRPGDRPALQPGSKPTPDRSHLDENAYAVNQGKRLFRWYNCSGCHGAGGGGGMGATLSDAGWRYGHEPAAIYATIVEGRPNGMPAFGGRIPEKEVWQLVAYVRSMSGLVSSQAAPNRDDAMQVKKPESEVEHQPPVDVSTPRP